MITLITGASHTGKTLLAQRLLEQHACPYLSIDHLKMGFIRSGQTSLTPYDDDALTEYLWSIVREIIKTAIENQQNLIVEGCYVPFDWRRDLDVPIPNRLASDASQQGALQQGSSQQGATYASQVRFICLAMTDAFIDAHIDEICAHSSDIESRLDDACCSVDELKADNRRCIEGFQRADEEVVLIDGDYEQAIRPLVEEGVASSVD